MPVSVQCTCGMSLRLKDELAGRSIKCPSCGAALIVPAAERVPSATPPSARTGGAFGYAVPRSRSQGPQKQVRFAFSGGAKWFIGAAIVIPTLIALATFGPVRVLKKLGELEPVAETDVTDVVNKTLYAWAEEVGYSMEKARDVPQTKVVILDTPIMPFVFPDTIDFQGRSSMGNFKGVYHTADRFIEAKIETIDGDWLEVTSKMEGKDRTFTRLK